MTIDRVSSIIMIKRTMNYSLEKLVEYSNLMVKSLKDLIKMGNCMASLGYGMKMEALQNKLFMRKEYLFLRRHGMRME